MKRDQFLITNGLFSKQAQLKKIANIFLFFHIQFRIHCFNEHNQSQLNNETLLFNWQPFD